MNARDVKEKITTGELSSLKARSEVCPGQTD